MQHTTTEEHHQRTIITITLAVQHLRMKNGGYILRTLEIYDLIQCSRVRRKRGVIDVHFGKGSVGRRRRARGEGENRQW